MGARVCALQPADGLVLARAHDVAVMALLLEGVAMVADTRLGRTVNEHLEVDEATQDEYGGVWKKGRRGGGR